MAGLARNVREGFADRLKLALKDAGHGADQQKELGVFFGVTSQAVRKWLRGEAMPTSEHAPLVAEKLGVRRAWLLDDELPMRPRLANMAEKGSGYTTAEDFSLSREEFKLISDYRSLPHSVRGTLEQLLETLKKELKRKS